MHKILYTKDALMMLKQISLNGITKSLRKNNIGRAEFRRMNDVLKTHDYNGYNDKKTLNKSYIVLSYIAYILERG